MEGIYSVPILIEMTVKISPDYCKEEVEKALLEEFSNRVLPDGRRGFFHSDNFTLGKSLLLSSLVKAAAMVPGVIFVNITKFERMDKLTDIEFGRSRIDVGPFEKILVEYSSVSSDKDLITISINSSI